MHAVTVRGGHQNVLWQSCGRSEDRSGCCIPRCEAGLCGVALGTDARVLARRLAFWLQPYGYFDGDASGDLAEAVSIFPSRGGRGATPVVVQAVANSFQCVPPEHTLAYSAAELQAL